MNCWIENCKKCKKVGLWEYIFSVSFKEWVDGCKWSEIIFVIVGLTIGYIGGSWIGLVVAFGFLYLMGTLEGGAVGDVDNNIPIEEFPPNKCSAGIKDCNICDNEYSHDFNVEYDKQYRKWYK